MHFLCLRYCHHGDREWDLANIVAFNSLDAIDRERLLKAYGPWGNDNDDSATLAPQDTDGLLASMELARDKIEVRKHFTFTLSHHLHTYICPARRSNRLVHPFHSDASADHHSLHFGNPNFHANTPSSLFVLVQLCIIFWAQLHGNTGNDLVVRHKRRIVGRCSTRSLGYLFRLIVGRGGFEIVQRVSSITHRVHTAPHSPHARQLNFYDRCMHQFVRI